MLSTGFRDSATFYNTIARYYDAENELMLDDLEFYSALAAESDDPILDVGCGTGRVMLHLAAEGHQIDGIDISRAMLDRLARKRQGRADLRTNPDLAVAFEGSAMNYAFPQKYALILITYNSFMHFRTQDSQIALLRNLESVLTDDGLLVFDLPNAGEFYASVDDGAVTYERSFFEPESGHMVMQQSVSSLNRAEQLQHISWIYDEIDTEGIVKRTVAPLVLRYVFPAELDLLLRISGLQRVAYYGDYAQNPFEETSERLVAVAKKA